MSTPNIWTDGGTDGNWTNTANWSTAAVPTNSSDVYIESSSRAIINNISSITFNSLNILPGFTGQLGTASAAATVGSSLGATPAQVNINSTGSGRIFLDASTFQVAFNVFGTGTSLDLPLEAVRLKGSNASNTLLTASGTTVGLGTTAPGDAITILTANISGVVNGGVSLVWTTMNVNQGGNLTLQTGSTSGTLTVASGGVATQANAMAVKIGTVNVGGRVYPNNRPGGDVITTANLFATGLLDFSGNSAAGTINSLVHYKGGTWANSPSSPNHITATTWTRTNGGKVTLG